MGVVVLPMIGANLALGQRVEARKAASARVTALSGRFWCAHHRHALQACVAWPPFLQRR